MVTIAKFVTCLLDGFKLNPLKLLSLVILQVVLLSTSAQAAPEPPVINLTVTDESISEAGPDPGSFTITRSDNGALYDPLDVYVAVTGEGGAWISPDCTYESMPRASGNVYKATIPPDQLSVTVVVTPKQDGLVEDDEDLIFTLQDTDRYTVGSNNQVQFTIMDDSPTVNLSLDDGYASEIGPDPGSFTISRSNNGILSQLLDVKVTTTGDAGTWFASDCIYEGLTRVYANEFRATIPPDELSVTIIVTPKQDTKVEGEETVIFTLMDSAKHRNGETNVVSITVADYVAEVFRDSFEDP